MFPSRMTVLPPRGLGRCCSSCRQEVLLLVVSRAISSLNITLLHVCSKSIQFNVPETADSHEAARSLKANFKEVKYFECEVFPLCHACPSYVHVCAYVCSFLQQQVEAFRAQHEVTLRGTNVPRPIQEFTEASFPGRNRSTQGQFDALHACLHRQVSQSKLSSVF